MYYNRKAMIFSIFLVTSLVASTATISTTIHYPLIEAFGFSQTIMNSQQSSDQSQAE